MQIEKAESQDIEFKKSWDDKYLHWVCAFANTQGAFFILVLMIKEMLLV